MAEVKKAYYNNGKIKSEKPYRNNALDEVIKMYYASGQLRQKATFKSEYQNGISKKYNKKAEELMNKTLYKEGRLSIIN